VIAGKGHEDYQNRRHRGKRPFDDFWARKSAARCCRSSTNELSLLETGRPGQQAGAALFKPGGPFTGGLHRPPEQFLEGGLFIAPARRETSDGHQTSSPRPSPAGAAGVPGSQKAPTSPRRELPVLAARDTGRALGRARCRPGGSDFLALRVVRPSTGSTGKTSTKELVASVAGRCRFPSLQDRGKLEHEESASR